MSERHMSVADAIELSSRIIQDDRALVEPLIKLIAGISNSRGDPLTESVRSQVLLHLYSKTEDCELHLRELLNETLLRSTDAA